MSETSDQRFLRLLKENNLTAVLQKPQVSFTDTGAILIEKPIVNVTFTDPKLEVGLPEDAVVIEDATGSSAKEANKKTN